MALNIIRMRLAKALQLNHKTSLYFQKRNPDMRRRASYKNGENNLPIRRSFTMSIELDTRLEDICDRYKIQRGVILRDALDFYLGVAAEEYKDIGALTGIDALPPKMADDKVRRPDGVVVSRFDADAHDQRK